MLSRRNKYFLDVCHLQKNRSWHHLLEKIRSVLHTGIGDIHNMAEKTGNVRVKEQGILRVKKQGVPWHWRKK